MRSRLSLLASVLLLTALSPASAVMFRPTDFLKVAGSPFEISVAPDSAPAAMGGPFVLEFGFRNTGSEKLTEIGIEVVVFSPEGELKGFFDLPIDAPMEPGGTGFLVYGASRAAEGRIDASEGDRIVLLPYSASGPRGRWQAAQGALRRARAALKVARGDASLVKDQESSGDDCVGSPTP